ncbi:MAG: protein kinase, partial [Gemmatimonadales bacterium]|nr:protein kinase [Gemmatimonadales bacterium]
FGIALAVSRSDGGTRMTETGMSLGTPHYMAPEQAMGEREITPKADIYALGCVLYEMLTAEPPFTGPTAQAIIARVMTEEPRSLTLQRRTVPAHVEAAVGRALEKLPADRFATAAQFSDALAGQGVPMPAPREGTVKRSAERPRRRWALPAAAVALLAAGLVGGRLLAPRGDGPPPARFSIQLPETSRLFGAPLTVIALSPDGRTIVYTGETPRGQEQFSRALDALEPSLIGGTEGTTEPRFSPDGRWLAFFQGTTLKRMPALGGPAVTVPTPPQGIFRYIWDDRDGFIVTTLGFSLGRLLGDGTIDTLAVPDTANGELGLIPGGILPDGSILTHVWIGVSTNGPVDAIDPSAGARRRILRTPVSGAWYAQGTLIWCDAGGGLFAAPFDAGRMTVGSTVTQLARNVRIVPGGLPQVVVSPGGALAYVPAQPTDLVRVDRGGRVAVITEEPRRYHSPRVSPDGRRVAFDVTERTRDVWLLDLKDRTTTRLSFQNDGHDPTWLPDGRSVTYMSARGSGLALLRSRADGSGSAESLLVFNNMSVHTYTPDGRSGVGSYSGIGGSWDIMQVDLDPGRSTTPVLATRFSESHAALSPDGRWLAYQSDESGRLEVYVRAFPGGGAKTLVSQGGGTEPVWNRNGRELFYVGTQASGEPMLFAASIATAPEFRVLSRTPLFPFSTYEQSVPHADYDVFPDGRSFVMVRQGRLGEIVYLQNWPEMVRRQSPASGR